MVSGTIGREGMRESFPACRSCGGEHLEKVLSLGNMPLANALLTPQQLQQVEPKYPLDLAFCPRCTLVQITETVPPDQLFTNYLYFSSFSETMLKDSEELAYRLITSRSLGENSLVVELGSNDGYQLQFFLKKGVPVLGIDPASNVARIAQEKGIRTLCRFFGEKLARELCEEGTCADIIIAKNVLAHVADLHGFVEGIRILLRAGGTAIIEVPYLKDLIDRREFDTIYHEHLCYFSLTALDHLFRAHQMILSDVERIPIHGGSLRLSVSHEGEAEPGNSVASLLCQERGWRVDSLESYVGFGREVENIRASLRSLIQSLKDHGKRVAAYGAAAKGAVLLNCCGIGTDLIDFAVDLNPHKQGLFLPGVHLRVYSPSRLLEEMPDYTLLLAWNIADEIVRQQAEYIRRGGRFIVPIPEPRVIGGA